MHTAYCLKCKHIVTPSEAHEEISAKGMRMLKGTCPACHCKVCKILGKASAQEGEGLLPSLTSIMNLVKPLVKPAVEKFAKTAADKAAEELGKRAGEKVGRIGKGKGMLPIPSVQFHPDPTTGPAFGSKSVGGGLYAPGDPAAMMAGPSGSSKPPRAGRKNTVYGVGMGGLVTPDEFKARVQKMIADKKASGQDLYAPMRKGKLPPSGMDMYAPFHKGMGMF